MPRCPWKMAYMYFDCVQKANISRCRRRSAKITRPLTLKFLHENCAEEMNNLRVTTSYSSLEAMRRSEGLNITPTQLSKVVSITR